LVKGDIPALEFVEKLGKKKPSATSLEAKDTYLLALLEKEEARLTWKKDEPAQQETKAPAAEPKNEAPAKRVAPVTPQEAFEAPVVSDDDDDDLPF
jgi:single-stranded DNA-binding protein